MEQWMERWSDGVKDRYRSHIPLKVLAVLFSDRGMSLCPAHSLASFLSSVFRTIAQQGFHLQIKASTDLIIASVSSTLIVRTPLADKASPFALALLSLCPHFAFAASQLNRFLF